MNANSQIRIKKIDSSMIADLIDLGEQTHLSRWTADDYLNELKLSTSRMFCLLDADGTMLGFAVGRIVPGGSEGYPEAEIYNIAVLPNLKGTGLASVLLSHFIEQCAADDAMAIWLEVRESNLRAIAFYKKFGFVEISRRDAYYRDPREAAIVMKKEN